MSFPRIFLCTARFFSFSLLSMASVAFCSPAIAENKAPEICDIVDSHAAEVLDAFHRYSQALSSGDPTQADILARYDTTRTELLNSLHQEADAMDSHEVPDDFRLYVTRYTAAERAFAKTLESNEMDSLFSDIDERNVAQHEFFAHCNEASRSSTVDKATREGEFDSDSGLSPRDGE